MNNTMEFTLADNVNGIGYFIGVSAGLLFLIATIAIATYHCNCSLTVPSSSPNGSQINPDNVAIEVGLDEITIQSYPTVLYSQATLANKTTASCCSICLSDYKNTDMLRLLPDCRHLFHLKCVDPWLRLHSTCPVCRNSPFASPLSTPLAVGVPLSDRMV